MACPYFLPTGPLQETGWAVPPRAPLGVLCAGECHAGPEPRPAEHERCNFGYARGVCPQFPLDAPIDAVRFTASGRYILERDHRPVEHGNEAGDRRILAAQLRIVKPK